MERERSNKVIVAMSGGVDSSVAAALLKREGFSVVGVFMKFWSEPPSGFSPQINADSNADLRGYENKCCSSENETRAREVAAKLKIPFYVFDFRKEFKKKVVDYFLKEYKAGRTPNPCVVCNKEIKFDLLFKKMFSLSADYIATGHYVRLRLENSNCRLFRGKDRNKDQSYFLWKLNQKILKKALFPIGDYTKAEVRNLASRFNLPVLGIPESQEVCFIPDVLEKFLEKHLKVKPGKIIDIEGKTIGEHQGLWFYTIGQRKGIELPGGPFYVLDKDVKKNLLIVTQNERDLYKKELFVKNANWIIKEKPKLPLKIKVQIRYGHPAERAELFKEKNRGLKVVFLKYQRAVTPGQSAVFYKGQELIGGAIIC